jgi:hypothetical protein
MSAPRPLDVRLIARVRAHLESPALLAVQIGDDDTLLDFLTRLAMEDIEALLRDAVQPTELERVLSVIEHRKGLLDADELTAEEAERRASLVASSRRIAADRRDGDG